MRKGIFIVLLCPGNGTVDQFLYYFYYLSTKGLKENLIKINYYNNDNNSNNNKIKHTYTYMKLNKYIEIADENSSKKHLVE